MSLVPKKKAERCDDSMDHPKYRGLNLRVAERLGVHENYISQVRNGYMKSDRVSKAVEQEMVKMDRERIAAERAARA